MANGEKITQAKYEQMLVELIVSNPNMHTFANFVESPSFRKGQMLLIGPRFFKSKTNPDGIVFPTRRKMVKLMNNFSKNDTKQLKERVKVSVHLHYLIYVILSAVKSLKYHFF